MSEETGGGGVMCGWYQRRLCIDCHNELTPANTLYVLSHGAYYPRPYCRTCKSIQAREAMRRMRNRRRVIEPVRGDIQFRRWLGEIVREVRKNESRSKT